MNATEVYAKSDGQLTKQFYAELSLQGALGVIAINLFRAQKASERAKKYSPKYRGLAYQKKGWSLEQLAEVLCTHGAQYEIVFGWGRDDKEHFNPWVFYVDLPGVGQVSFHSPTRYKGPDYGREWDGQKGVSASRIVQFCQSVYDQSKQGASLTGSITNWMEL